MDVKIIAELKEAGYEPIPKRPPDFGITVNEFMENQHCSEDMARDLLSRAFEDGVLGRHDMITGPKAVPIVYHRLGDWPPK